MLHHLGNEPSTLQPYLGHRLFKIQCQKGETRYCTLCEETAHNKVQCILNNGCTGVRAKQRTKHDKRTVSVTA